mmetsp:Transcript_49210/g.96239  ORF Transcript_49210/g.96239 Transcript_49210/m.96239 type:complete len:107 (-) Transcript_49210:112-432(-)
MGFRAIRCCPVYWCLVWGRNGSRMFFQCSQLISCFVLVRICPSTFIHLCCIVYCFTKVDYYIDAPAYEMFSVFSYVLSNFVHKCVVCQYLLFPVGFLFSGNNSDVI